MEHFFLIILIFLTCLAAFDLFVGVSNDAVNFLNSAVGSRIAPFGVVMAIASLGVLFGATFSSGMMEVARSGVFNPEMFNFQEVMVIFFAVMISDVLMLDIFNSFGMPTSTTVSIVFELLGGAVAIAAYKLYSNPEMAGSISDYINNEKALAIISAILISVVVAFSVGVVVQYITRLIFSFKFEKIYRYIGSIFGGMALTAILYFLVMKGAKGASFMKKEYLEWINTNTISILLYTFAVLTIIFQLLITFFKVNIFRVIILVGTFALAFAFAGNDLVNFVGVPLAARDSYLAFIESGATPEGFMMDGLREAVKTPTFLLLIAGLIMVATLTFSKKAKRVVQTSINLSSSSRGAKEQFGSSLVGRVLVRGAIKLGKVLHQVLPSGVFKFIDSRMEKPTYKKGEIVLPFDHVRASINLVVSAILIASATSLKLPLSTTYVTFMVAMGSSLADGAWDRESAVYRISGVLAVIGGWFLTALSAFTLCAVVSVFVFWGGEIATIALMLIVAVVLIRSNFFPSKKTDVADELDGVEKVDRQFIASMVNQANAKYFDAVIHLYKDCLTAFSEDKLRKLRDIRSDAASLQDEISKRRGHYYAMATDGSEDKVDRDARHYYYRVFTNLKEIGHGLRSVVGTAYNHIDNNHTIFKGSLRDNLDKMIADLEDLSLFIQRYTSSPVSHDGVMQERADQSIALLNQLQSDLLQSIDEEQLSLRSSELYLNYLQFSRDLVNRFALIALLQHELDMKASTGYGRKPLV